MSSDLEGFWLIYDGDCPVCRSTAHAFSIRKEYGVLNLVNARAAPDHPACKKARVEGLDLDEGMVIFAGGAIYHGAGAVSFLAAFGAPASLLTRAGLMLHRSPGLSACVYQAMRGLRNILLRLRRIGPINNLHRSD